MTSSGYVWNELFEKRAARPHDRQNKLWDNHKRTPEDAARFAAAGDLHTTPTDYAKFLIEVLDPKPVDAWRLNKASMKEMLRPQVKVDESRSWALGWQIYHDKSGDLIQHGGNNRGFHAFTSASVERKCGFIIMTNGENGWPMITTPALGDAMTSLMG
jgi:CubicO group peptidase (beta-lactamase class C family)